MLRILQREKEEPNDIFNKTDWYFTSETATGQQSTDARQLRISNIWHNNQLEFTPTKNNNNNNEKKKINKKQQPPAQKNKINKNNNNNNKKQQQQQKNKTKKTNKQKKKQK